MTADTQSIGDLKIVPLIGYDLPIIFANLLVFVVLIFVLGVHKQIKKLLGIPTYEYNSKMNNLMCKEGKKLIVQEKPIIFSKMTGKRLDMKMTLVRS